MMVGDNKTVDQAQREGGDDSNNKKRFFQTSNPHITYRGLQFSTPIQGKEPHTQGGLWDATGTAAYTQESHLMVDYENSRPRRNWGGGKANLGIQDMMAKSNGALLSFTAGRKGCCNSCRGTQAEV